MKWKMLILLMASAMLLLTGCIKKVIMEATVIEAESTQVIVKDDDKGTEIAIDSGTLGEHDIEELLTGDRLRIEYDGDILETYPARISKLYNIEFIE